MGILGKVIEQLRDYFQNFQSRRVVKIIDEGHSIDVETAKQRLGSMRLVCPKTFGDGTECWLVEEKLSIDRQRQVFSNGLLIIDDQGNHLQKKDALHVLGILPEAMGPYR